jgi:hypothetical protein
MKCNTSGGDTKVNKYTKNRENKKDNGYWLKQENQREFLKRLFNKLSLKDPVDWGNVRRRDVISEPGGNSFLSVYNGNYFSALQGAYPELKETFSDAKKRKRAGYWKSRDNQRQHFEELFHELGLKHLGDWKTVTLETLFNLKPGARGVISQNGGNFKRTLMNLYPNYVWNFSKLENKPRTQKKQKKMQNGHWGNIENQRSYFAKLYSNLGLTNLRDWEEIKIAELKKQSGCVLPRYRGNFRLAISKVYPNFPWSFVIKRNKKRGYWNVLENQRTWMEKKADELKLKSVEEWVTITKDKLIVLGGYGVLRAHHRNFHSLLSSVYPNYDWDRVYVIFVM